jgi:glycerol-3-phosphate cytidylyltransferase
MKIGFTCGAFDLFHAGHMLMFKECKEYCDYLIVGLHTDPTIDRPEKNKPIQSIEERMIQLEAIKYIDKIITYDTEQELYEILSNLPDPIFLLRLCLTVAPTPIHHLTYEDVF